MKHNFQTTSGGAPLTGLDAAQESDKRLVVVTFPADEGTSMWLTGASDDIENGIRGNGVEIALDFDDVVRPEPETQIIDVQFLEWVQLHDGQVSVTNPAQWSFHDRWRWSVHFDATEVVPNAQFEGNCNVVNEQGQPGQPDSVIIIPAAGDGAFDVDLATAVPVPQSGGFWSYDYPSDTLVPSATGSFLLLTIEKDAYFMPNVAVPAHPTGVFDFDAYKAERIYAKRWKLRWQVTKKGNGPGSISGWLVCFREYNT